MAGSTQKASHEPSGAEGQGNMAVGQGPAHMLPAPVPSDSRSSKADDATMSPPREVPLSVLSKRSEPLCISSSSLARGLDAARRLDALEWLVQAFDALGLPDVHLFAAFGLLDRFAAASTAPISAGPGAFALVLASMLVALKVLGTPKDLERGKRLVVEVSGSSRPWAAVKRAEVQILRRLSFRACTPTSRDLLERLLSESPQQAQDAVAWDADSKAHCSDLARFLLEVSTVHDPDTVYSSGRPPLAAALAALLLALLAHGAPRQLVEATEREPLRLLGREGPAMIRSLAEAMRLRWVQEERRANGGGTASAVMEKWVRRAGTFGTAPPSAGDLRYLVGSRQLLAETASDAAAARMPRRSLGMSCQPGSDVIATLPTPSRQASKSAAASSENPNAKQVTVKEEPKDEQESKKPEQSHASQRLSQGHEQSEASSGQPAPTAPPVPPPGRSPEMLVELTHVLNLVVPRPQQSGATSERRGLQPPSVAAELLISSALRMQWAVDKRKVSTSDAAKTCREAAAVLQEAAAQLSAAATSMEGGAGTAARDIAKAALASSETKRRRTFGGGAGGGAAKPTSPQPAAGTSRGTAAAPGHASQQQQQQRGSPPIRFTGLRV